MEHRCQWNPTISLASLAVVPCHLEALCLISHTVSEYHILPVTLYHAQPGYHPSLSFFPPYFLSCSHLQGWSMAEKKAECSFPQEQVMICREHLS